MKPHKDQDTASRTFVTGSVAAAVGEESTVRYSGMIDGVVITEEARRQILDPAPGTALARARDFGIDLTLILRNISLTPEQRLEKAEGMMRSAHEIRSAKRV